MSNSVFKIKGKDNKFAGTGFAIDYDEGGCIVATCSHVIKQCEGSVYINDIKSKIIVDEESIDLALLHVEKLEADCMNCKVEPVVKSAKVTGYSSFMHGYKKESIDNISVKRDVEIQKGEKIVNAYKLTTQTPISHGYSGSPVLCEITGNVFAILTHQAGKETNYAICISNLLDHYHIKRAPNSPNFVHRRLKTELTGDMYRNIKKTLEKDFNNTLKLFRSSQYVWVEPKLFEVDEKRNALDDGSNPSIALSELIENPRSIIIKGRQQFGLSSLARYLSKASWESSNPRLWLYLDATDLKPYPKEITKVVDKKLIELGLCFDDISCVVLDEFSCGIKNASKLLKEVSSVFHQIPLLVMASIVDNPLINAKIEIPENRTFESLYIWSLPRKEIRKIVEKYNNEKYLGDESAIVDRVVTDLEVLNIPRTPLNCLTILKIYEVDFDESPVNRTEMIRRVLFLLFNVDSIPQYKTRPDVKDAEYILGYFCETLLKDKRYHFSRDEFLKTLKLFCVNNEIDVEVDVIFEVLHANNIVVKSGYQFCFKFSYWVFYFAAHRMHHNSEFSEYILADMKYASYPEIIEFYTGIDRRRNDALKYLISDIQRIREVVEDKCGLPIEFNIFDLAKWKPSESVIENMHSELTDGVLSSNLPEQVKDQYADKTYNRARPLQQSITEILEEYSLQKLMKTLQAGSRALRNSDYSNTDLRHRLLDEILQGWEQIMRVLVVITPVLSQDGYATFEGASFYLIDKPQGSEIEKFNYIIQMLPTNVVNWYKDDVFTKKMGPMLYKYMGTESSNFMKHTLNLLLVKKRPKNWNKMIKNYIVTEHKNSFYLYDLYNCLRSEYRYSFASRETLMSLAELIKMAAAKHELGIKKPNKKVINKVKDDILPERV